MLNFDYDPDQQRFRTELPPYACERLTPHARRAEEDGRVPDEARGAITKIDLPGHDGFASGASDPISFCLAAEGLAHGDAGIAYAWLASRQVAWLIASCGTNQQKARWLPRFAEDPLLPASLFLLEGRGLAPSETETTVTVRGNHIVVNGFKSPVMYPETAEISVIVGKDEGGRLTAVVAERLGDAVSFRGLGTRRLAMTACPSALEARIEALELPADAAMNGDGLHRALTECRLAHASLCVGTAIAATRYAAEYARERIAFGKPIIGFQGVSFPLIDMLLEADAVGIEILRLLSDRELTHEARDRKAAAVMSQTNQLVIDAGREGVQTMAVAGVITEHPQERAYRSAGVLASIDFDPLRAELILR